MFEGTLARKYISAQKRHSALTICSIAIALAIIATLFSLFSTVMSIMRNIAYKDGDYHIMITGTLGSSYYLTREQYDAVEKAVGDYGTCTPETFGTSTGIGYNYHAKIMLDKDINSAKLFVDKIGREIGLKQDDGLVYTTNPTLMELDMRTDDAKLAMLATIAVYYVFVLFFIMMLRLIIDTAFEISSKERERQFGVLQSIGATPKQIVKIITCEGLMLSVVGIPIGTALGVGLAYLIYRTVLGTGLLNNNSSASAAELVHFSVNPWLLLLGVVTGLVWVLLSAYGTGMRVIKMSPVEAISGRSNTVKRVSRSPMLGRLFGWTGKLASRNNKRQPRRFAAAIVALTLSIADFSATMVVVSDIRGAAEVYFDENTPQSDFIVYIPYIEDEPFPYRSPLNEIEGSGLFEEFDYWLGAASWWYAPEADGTYKGYVGVTVEYHNRNSYEHLFDGAPPVSYDELTNSGKYIFRSAYFDNNDSIALDLMQTDEVSYSEEEYNALPPEEKEKCKPLREIDGEQFYGYTPKVFTDFDIYRKVEADTRSSLIATIDEYENGAYLLYKDMYVDDIYCNLKDVDNDYYKAVDFLEQNGVGYTDNTAEHRQFLAALASVKIVAISLSVLIALIAVVNMVNVLATGILNRRAELAALQCVGMTEKDLRKMTLIECLQYALTSGIAAVFVCEALMLLTKFMLTTLTDVVEFEFLNSAISFVQPLPIIFIASICAFIIAIAASILALRASRKMTLVEQIRSVE